MKRLVCATAIVLMLVSATQAIAAISGKVTNAQIALEALEHVDENWGATEGTCKRFVQIIVNSLQPDLLGAGYRSAFTTAGEEITESELRYGDIIQTYNPQSTDDKKFEDVYHTAIFLSRSGTPGKYHVVDSNRVPPFGSTVAIGAWDPFAHAAKYGHQVYFYRLGTMVGFFPDGWQSEQSGVASPKFLDSYLAYGAYTQFGAPWDSGRTEYVHCWPDACGDPNRLWLQDFLTEADTWSQLVYNQYKDTVYPVTERILEYWYSNTGYSTYGPPLGSQVDWTDGFHYQLFDKPDGTSWYIRCTDAGQCNAGQKSALSSALKAALDQTLTIAGADDDSTDLPPPPPPSNGVPCLEPWAIPEAQRSSHYNGLVFNGSLTICGAHGWVEHSQGGSASISQICAASLYVFRK